MSIQYSSVNSSIYTDIRGIHGFFGNAKIVFFKLKKEKWGILIKIPKFKKLIGKNGRPLMRAAVSKQANLTNQNGLSFNPVARLFVQLTPWEFYH